MTNLSDEKNIIYNAETRINGVPAHSNSVILPTSRDYAEIIVNKTNFKLEFEDNGEKPKLDIEHKENTIIFNFKNVEDPLGSIFYCKLPLTSGGHTEIQFLIYTIGHGPDRSISINYTFRDIEQ